MIIDFFKGKKSKKKKQNEENNLVDFAPIFLHKDFNEIRERKVKKKILRNYNVSVSLKWSSAI